MSESEKRNVPEINKVTEPYQGSDHVPYINNVQEQEGVKYINVGVVTKSMTGRSIQVTFNHNGFTYYINLRGLHLVMNGERAWTSIACRVKQPELNQLSWCRACRETGQPHHLHVKP
jgi:hypothetical protein